MMLYKNLMRVSYGTDYIVQPANCWFQKCLFRLSAKKSTYTHLFLAFCIFQGSLLKISQNFKQSYITSHHILVPLLQSNNSSPHICFYVKLWIQCCLPSSTCPFINRFPTQSMFFTILKYVKTLNLQHTLFWYRYSVISL